MIVTRTTIARPNRPHVIVSTIEVDDGFETTSWEFDGRDRAGTSVKFEGKDFTIRDAMVTHGSTVMEISRE